MFRQSEFESILFLNKLAIALYLTFQLDQKIYDNVKLWGWALVQFRVYYGTHIILWHSWQSCGLLHQRFEVRIPLVAKNTDCIEKTKFMEKEAGNGSSLKKTRPLYRVVQ